MKKPQLGTKADAKSAAADINGNGKNGNGKNGNGERRKALLSTVKTMTCLAGISVFVIRVVMDYLIHYNSALLANARRVEYAFFFFWAAGLAACAALKLSLGRGSVLSRLGGLLRSKFRVEYGLLLGILIWGILSCVSMGTAYKGDFVAANRYAMEDMAVCILVFFPMGFLFQGEAFKKILKSCLRLMIAVTTVLMIAVIWNVFRSNVVRLPEGLVIMRDGNMLEISSNRNTVAAYAAFTAFLCPVLMLSTDRKWEKALYVFAFIVHWVIQCLTQSATGLIVGSLTGGLMTAFFLMERGQKIPFRRRLLTAAICGAAAMVLLWMSRKWIFRFYQICIGASADSLRDMSANNTFSGRLTIWRAAVRAIFGYNGSRTTFRNAMFGYTFAGVPSIIKILCGLEMYTHNEYMEVGAAMGIPALLAYIAFSVFMGMRCAGIALADQNRVKLKERFIPVLVLSLVVGNLTEAMLMGYGFMTSCFFFLMCGWCSRKSRDIKKSPLSAERAEESENAGFRDAAIR